MDRTVGLQDTLAALERSGLQGVMQGDSQALEARSNEKEYLPGCATRVCHLLQKFQGKYRFILCVQLS